MQVSYGPPGHKGVTHLMAVGDCDYGTNNRPVKIGAFVSLGVIALGLMTKNKTTRNLGIGAALALYGVQLATGTLGTRLVPVTTAVAP